MPMTNDGKYVAPTYGVLGAFKEVFNAIGATASNVNNLASGAAEFTSDLPKLGYLSGRIMTERAIKSLEDQKAIAAEV